MKVVLIATRDVSGPLTGRKAVLRTIIRALTALEHEVLVIVVGRQAFGPRLDESLKVPVVGFKLPSILRILVNVLQYNLRGKLSLNECLYFSPRLCTEVRALSCDQNADLVVADMIRTAELAAHAGLPWLLDLDDLLSSRYEAWCEEGGDLTALLGYYGDTIPPFLRAPARWLAASLLRHEAKQLATREVELARRATAVSLVSETEANQFTHRCGRRVHSMPMALDVRNPCGPAPWRRPLEMVFTGGLDYQPNREAVLYFARAVVPELKRGGIDEFRLHVFGKCPPAILADLESEHLVLHGYVDKLHDALSSSMLFLCPLQSGTGVKTKIVEALLHGIPVVTTPIGTQGLDLPHRARCYVWTTPRELVGVLRDMETAPQEVVEVARAGQDYARERFSPHALQRRWAEVLANTLNCDHHAQQQSTGAGIEFVRPLG